jgi:hypothetical protein
MENNNSDDNQKILFDNLPVDEDKMQKQREMAKEYNNKWREENKDKIKEYHKKWREENPEKVKSSMNKWREENPEKFKGRPKEMA